MSFSADSAFEEGFQSLAQMRRYDLVPKSQEVDERAKKASILRQSWFRHVEW